MWEIETFREIAVGGLCVNPEKTEFMIKTGKNDSRNVNLLVYPAISLADQISRIIQKFIFELAQKEIISNNFLR